MAHKRYDPDIHHRRSIRLKGYDYAQSGAYYITIVTQNRECLFGHVTGENEVTLSQLGNIVTTHWQRLPTHFPGIELDAFVTMPNHLHGIVVILEQTGLAPQPQRGTQPGSLPAIIQNFKSVTTRRINKLQHTPGVRIWQRNYYEHIIRSEQELNRIRRYIAENPLKWAIDEENPANW